MKDQVLGVEKSGGIWHVTLDRPQQGNALTAELVRALGEVLAGAERDGALALVLQGAGRNFCTGFDLSSVEDETDDSMLARFVRIELLLQQVARAPFPTVAIARGRVIGAGADIFAACSVRLVDGDASFAFPGARGFGLVLGTRRLSAHTGRAVALEWVRSARTVQASEALSAGLVTAIVAGIDEVQAAIARAVEVPPSTGKALADAVAPDASVEDALDLDHLVRSAAIAGLRNRIAEYVERNARKRNAEPG